MRVLLDDAPCDVTAATVGEAIAAGSALAEREGRLIIEVLVDGVAWTGQAGEAEAATSRRADEVRLTSADPLLLVRQIFTDAAEALADADRLQQSSAELLQGGESQLAMERLAEAVTIWQTVQQAMTMGIEAAGIELDRNVGSRAKPADLISRLNEHLRLMQRSLEQGDHVALADTLLYEMPPVVQEWRHLLEDLSAHLTGGKDI